MLSLSKHGKCDFFSSLLEAATCSIRPWSHKIAAPSMQAPSFDFAQDEAA
jgi:hypothetical protein